MVGPVAIDLRPQEVPWSVPLDQGDQHATYHPEQVSAYLAAATRAAAVLGEVRAPFRGRSTPVNAWWGSFDLAVSLFSGQPRPGSEKCPCNAMDSEEIAIGWWPDDERHPRAAFYAYAHPAPPGYGEATLEAAGARREPSLGEYVLDWDDGRRIQRLPPDGGRLRDLGCHAPCSACGWDAALHPTIEGHPPPVR